MVPASRFILLITTDPVPLAPRSKSALDVVTFKTLSLKLRDESIVRNEFAGLKELFLKFQSVSKDLQIISMGMSADYEIAIDQGSTMVRVGSAIFGRRN